MPEKYLWSSYQYYIGKKKKPDWLSIDFVLGYFEHNNISAERTYAGFVSAKIFDSGDSPLEKTIASTMLGSESFIEKIIDEHLGATKKNRELPALRELRRIENIDLVYEEVISTLGDSNKISKKVTLYICHNFSGKTLKEIGAYFGIGESAVSLASSRLSRKLRWNRKLSKNIELIIDKLNLQIV